ncbi:olfactory receptor 1N2-like [Erethizon dorsatum]
MISEFLLFGLSEVPEHQPLLFSLFLFMYLVAVMGNLLIIMAISSTPKLHTPMYFFIANLSFVDICFTSVTIPKMLLNIQTQSQSIPYAGCLIQMYFLILFLELDNVLLAVMAYDRYSKLKAFSTCSSHLAVVYLFYGTLFGVYLRPSSSYTVEDSVATVLYAVVTPMLNPFIYSLRNKDMQRALKGLFSWSKVRSQ